MKRILFIGGTDPSGGAGLQADLRSANDLGCWGLSAVTSVVAQNTVGVFHCEHLSPDILKGQLDAIQRDIQFDAIKIGMIGSIENLNIVSEFINFHATIPVVLDPIYFDGSGTTQLSNDQLFQTMLEVLGKRTTVITPNANEAFAWMPGEIDEVMQHIHSFGPDVLLKSGHLACNDSSSISDYWYDADGFCPLMPYPRKNINPRGTGCHLASAIAVGLAEGKSTRDAVEDGRAWLAHKFEHHLTEIGKGRRLIR